MKITINSFIIGLAMLGMFSPQGKAATVNIQPDVSVVAPFDVLILSMNGEGFTTNTDGGDFKVSWDPTVLSYTSTTLSYDPNVPPDPINPWDIQSIDDTNVAAGNLSIAAATSIFGGVGPNFNIGTLTFEVIGPVGSSATISAADNLGLGWAAPGEPEPIVVTYNDATVNVVPVPAALWLFGSGLLGLVAMARKRKSA